MTRQLRKAISCVRVVRIIVAAVLLHAVASHSQAQQPGGLFDSGSLQFRYPANWGVPTVVTVKSCPLLSPTDIPDGVAPEHIAVVFSGTRPIPKDYLAPCSFPVFDLPEVRIFPVAAYADLYPDGARALSALRRLLNNGSHAPGSEVPYVPFVDASPAFTEHFAFIPFRNGSGAVFLTQWMTEPDAIGEHLVYIFQGLSADGKTYVLATFPTTYSGTLPAFTVPQGERIEQTQTRYKPYAKGVAHTLGKAKESDFSPSLSDVQALLSSIRLK